MRQAGPLLAVLVVVAFITFTILPSSLNLPQSNPTTVLEYAPIPPEDDSPPPISSAGGLSSLGLAGSGTLTSALPPPPDIKSKLPPVQRQKRCVGGRQTEDPNSPPCQSYFEGDNGGPTWLGVTPDEVRVLFTASTGIIIDQGQGAAEPTPGAGTYCDVDLLDCDNDADFEPDENPHIWMRIANSFSRYFNTRYQTYGRHVHAYMYWTGANSAAGRRGDAADNYDRIQPFATFFDLWNGGFAREYITAMAQNEISIFGAFQGEPRSYFQQYAPKVWSFWPDVENWADSYVNYVCTKAGPNSRVNHAGSGFPGQPRVYGLLHTRDPAYPSLHHMKNLVVAGLEQCGINIKVTKSFRQSGFWFNNQNRGQDRAEAAQNMAAFADADVNTLLWPGGTETHHSEAGATIGYFPEVVVAGDASLDGRGYATRQNQEFWQYAWAHSYQIRDDIREKTPGYQAYKEADPNGTDYNWAINQYRQYFMLFMAIQVAGPKLSPAAVDAGMHAIQRRESTNPFQASLWFHPGDYSGVKDANEMWWNRSKRDPNGNAGCYQMVRGGFRYAADRWSQSLGAGIDVPGYNNPDDPCTAYNGVGVAFQPGA